MAELLYANMKDIMFGLDTDIHFENDDLMLTSTGTDFIEREVYKLLITEKGDWGTNLRLGASPVKFAGEPNTRESAAEVEQYLEEGLAFAVAPSKVKARCVPTNYESIMIFIDIYSPDAIALTMPFEFNYVNGISKLTRADPRTVKPRSSSEYQINDISNLKKPNKYWDRQRLNSQRTFA